MKRQRGRGRKPGGGGGGGNHGNRPLESNGPDVKIRGTAAQIYEKYSQYARDAQSGGDRVKYENYLQHAEHYYRVMVATMPRDRIFQPQEGGMPQQQPGGEERPAGLPGEEHQQQPNDPLKVMDDQGGDDGDDFEGDEGDDGREGEEVEASANAGGGGQDDRQEGGQGHGRGRRRRGRRRHHDGPQGDRQNASYGGNNNGGGNGGDQEARSALDSLARKQGALAGD
ncbi:MAG TPA: DUF4167 domain-containing protein [Hyphomonadaceae bacterium]|nr:DUF4167 domain-containing protein [Hyphomonadaceae bacterium]